MAEDLIPNTLIPLLDAMVSLKKAMTDDAVRARALQALEDEVLALLPKASAEPVLAQRLMDVGRKALLVPYLEAHPTLARNLEKVSSRWKTEWLSEAETSSLIWIDEKFFGKVFEEDILFAEVSKRDDETLFETLMARRRPLAPFTEIPAAQAQNIIFCSGPRLAAQWGARLRAALRVRTATIEALTTSMFFAEDLKVVSALACIGLDLTEAEIFPDDHHPTAINSLIRRTGSAHGRLSLRAQEPDLEAILARPHSGVFFGFTVSGNRIVSAAPEVVA